MTKIEFFRLFMRPSILKNNIFLGYFNVKKTYYIFEVTSMWINNQASQETDLTQLLQ